MVVFVAAIAVIVVIVVSTAITPVCTLQMLVDLVCPKLQPINKAEMCPAFASDVVTSVGLGSIGRCLLAVKSAKDGNFERELTRIPYTWDML